MGSSTCSDLYAGILSKEITVFDKNGPGPKEKVEDFFKQGKDKQVLHEDQRLMVGLHSLPASTSQLDGYHVFKEKPVQTLRPTQTSIRLASHLVGVPNSSSGGHEYESLMWWD
jgi:hypothetical protein